MIAHIDDRAALIVNRPDDEGAIRSVVARLVIGRGFSRDGRLVLFTEGGHGGGTGEFRRRARHRWLPGRASGLRPRDRALARRAMGALRGSGRTPVALSRRLCPPAPASPVGSRPASASATPSRRAGCLMASGFCRLGDRAWPRPCGCTSTQLGSGRPPLVLCRGFDGTGALSPDGKTIAATGPGAAIRLYPVDGSASRELAGMSGGEVPIGRIWDGCRSGDPANPECCSAMVSSASMSKPAIRNSGRTSCRGSRWPPGSGFVPLTQPDGRAQVYTLLRAIGTLYEADGLA